MTVQLLDGLGAGSFGAMQLLVIGDLTKGRGHFDLTQGIGTAVGIGASLSNCVAGFYSASFLSMAAISPMAVALLWFFMPESSNFELAAVEE